MNKNCGYPGIATYTQRINNWMNYNMYIFNLRSTESSSNAPKFQNRNLIFLP